jgi:hypothetical protein
MKRALSRAIVALLAAVISPAGQTAERCVKESPAHAVALVELYTSEGCDSCPPADRWLSRLQPGVAGDSVVALALHVDYWDRLGWPDRFASPRYTERQQLLSRNGGASFVYTPGVFLNLREFRGWSSQSSFRAALTQFNARPAGADIRLELDLLSPAQLSVKADFRSRESRPPQAFLALYESHLTTDVKAGENRGVTLRHGYVVREWIGPVAVNGNAGFAKTLALKPDWKPRNLGIAAFVQDAGGSELLQATALAVCAGG